MLKTRLIDEKEKESFNKFIASHPKGHFLQIWEWGQVKRHTGWEPLYLILEEDEVIKGSMLLLKRALPTPGIKRCILYSPRGPVVDINQKEYLGALLAGVKKVAREHKAIFLKIDPDIPRENGHFARQLGELGFIKNETGQDFEGVQPVFVFRLDITPSEEQLLANMHSKTRYNIRLAARKGVKVRVAENIEDLKIFYAILCETAKRDQFLVRNFNYFQWIWDYMVQKGYAQVFLAEYEGQAVSAALAMVLGKKAWYLYGASSNEHRNVMPNYLIQWEMIKWAGRQGCTLYDFRGVSGNLDENNPLYGLYRFKKGFNGELVEFVGEWDMVFSRWFYWLWQKVLPLYQKKSR
jgi:peptidoglycan pentaglycine glycine transferase (the first glycine)